MNGYFIRGFRHFLKSVETTKPKKFFIVRHNRIFDGEALKLNDNTLVLFQGVSHNEGRYSISISDKNLYQQLKNTYNGVLIVKNQRDLFNAGTYFFITDFDFDKKYDEFTSKNKKLLEQVFNKYCYKNDVIPQYIFATLGDSPNMFVWALTNLYKNHINISLINNIINWFNRYGKLVNKLSKGTITAYNGYDKVFQLQNEMLNIKREKRAKDAINMFNTVQKKLLKSLTLDNKLIGVLNKFGNLSNIKKINFIRKMSTIDDVNEIIRQMSLLTNVHFEWNKESVLEFIKYSDKINCNIVIDRDNILLIKVNTYDTVKLLAKTTNWCISKNKSYWNNYVEQRGGTQYILFDFNRPEDDLTSIVGFTTVRDYGISNAHNFNNGNLMSFDNEKPKLKSFIVSDNSNIFSILKNNKISLNSFMELSKPYYEWDFNVFLNFLNYCFENEEDYTIHYCDEEENKIVISTKNKNVRFICPGIEKVVNINEIKNKIFLFLDFNCDDYDENRILFSLIYNNHRTKEEYSDDVFNILGKQCELTFDSLCSDFYLPYDVISRTSNKNKQFETAFKNFNEKALNELLKDDEVIDFIANDKNQRFYQMSLNVIYDSFFYKKSFDYFDIIYNNGRTLKEIIGLKSLNSFIGTLLGEIIGTYARMDFNFPLESDGLKELVESKSFEDKFRYAIYHLLHRIMNNEKYNDFYNYITEKLNRFSNVNYNFKKFIYKIILKNYDFTVKSNNLVFIHDIINLCDEELNNIILGKDFSKENINFILNTNRKPLDIYKRLSEKYSYSTVCAN